MSRMVTTIGDLGGSEGRRLPSGSRVAWVRLEEPNDGIGSLMGLGEGDDPGHGVFVPVLIPPSGQAMAIPEPEVVTMPEVTIYGRVPGKAKPAKGLAKFSNKQIGWAAAALAGVGGLAWIAGR